VKHDAARPFSVATPFGSVTDIGTAFDIRLGRRQTLVTVAEGTVRVAAHGDGAWRDVIRNQQVPLQLSADGSHAVIGAITPASGRAAANWTSGWLRFEGAPLAQVVEEVNRYAPQHLALADGSRAKVPVYGIFKVGDVEGLLALVAAQPGIGPRALKVEGKP
jgi:transmembrane sensor